MNPLTLAVQSGQSPAELRGGRTVRSNPSADRRAEVGRGDQVSLSRTPDPDPKYVEVVVEPWKKGERNNSSLSQILLNQGYSRAELEQTDADGRSFMDRVAAGNELKNANLVHPGQKLRIPVREQQSPAQERTPETTGPVTENAADNQPEQSGPVKVKVDAWGKGPNSSLEGILRQRGYSAGEIYSKDGQGRTMIDRLAAENGLEDANRLRPGQTIEVPARSGQTETPPANDEQRTETPPANNEQRTETPPANDEQRTETPPVNDEQRTETPPANNEQRTETPPANDEQPNNGNSNATLEMGLVLNGVKDGKLNRNEFQALNTYANRYEETRSEYSQDGFTPQELRELGAMEKQYGDLYVRFLEHDRSRINFNASQTDDPRVQVRLRHTEESGQLYDRYSAGEADDEQAITEMMRQRGEARQLGRQH